METRHNEREGLRRERDVVTSPRLKEQISTRRKTRATCAFSLALLSMFLFTVDRARSQDLQPTLITDTVDESRLVPLTGNRRLEATAQYDRGRVPDNFSMQHLLLLLKRSSSQEHALEKLIEELHNPSSPNFHRWLTAAEFGQRFGVAKQDRDTIIQWLQSHGLSVDVDYTNSVLIDFSGTAAQIQEAFRTEIHYLNVRGEKHTANMSDPQIPAALAPAIVGVVSLHDFHPHPMYRSRPLYTVSVNGTENYLVVPGDLATIYNWSPLFNDGISGQNQTIVAIEDSDVYSTADWTSFRSTFGLSSYTDGSLTQIHPAPPTGANNCSDPGDMPGSDREAIIDAEYASAAAPNAAILLASCSSTQTFGGLIALQNLLNQGSAPPAIVSVSYGECEALNGAASNAAFNLAFQQAVAEGVSVFVGTGDNASAFCDRDDVAAEFGVAITGFGSSPYDVAVGGTDFGDTFARSNSTYWRSTNSATYESALSYVPEIPWNNSCGSSLLAQFEGFSEPYGANGFCNSTKAQTSFLNTNGGGGGPSGCATGTPSVSAVVSGTCAGWPKPSYQKVFGNPGDGVRDVPDVSLFAANGVWLHSYPYCYSGTGGTACSEAPVKWPSAGGTSFAAPIMAGIQALVNQKVGDRQGNPNFGYYKLAANEYGTTGSKNCNSTLGSAIGASCVFHDVTEGDNDVVCVIPYNCYSPSGGYGVLSTSDTGYQPAFAATTGWDFATGIGTVNAYNLANSWGETYNLTTSVSSLSVVQGSQAKIAITVVPENGFTGSVTLAASGLPTGVTASFSANPTTTASTLTLTASSTAKTGTFTVTITGSSGNLSQNVLIKLSVTAPQAYTLSASPTSLTVAQGSAWKSTITVLPVNGFKGSVTLSASGLPGGVTAGFSTNPVTNTSTLTLTASGTAPTGTSTITIAGTSGSLPATTQIQLTVTQAPSFMLTANPNSLTVVQGAQGSSVITVLPANGFTGSVSLSASGMPAGVTAVFITNPTVNTSTLTLVVSASAATGTSTLTINGSSGSLTAKAQIQLIVNAAPSYTLTPNPASLTIAESGQGKSTISVVPANGFKGSVTLSASGLPSGVTAAFSTNPTTNTSTLTLNASATATTGTSSVTITGESGLLQATSTLPLNITPAASFNLTVSPFQVIVPRGSKGTTLITVVPSYGFNGQVMLSTCCLPTGVSASFSTNPTTNTSTLTLAANNSALTGTFIISVTGTSGTLVANVGIQLSVAQ